VRILYLNHTSHMSGGERSLLELLDALPGDIEPHVACPPGALADAIASRGIAWHTLAGTDGSLKLHPIHTPRTVVELARATRAVRGLCRRHRIDVVHANSIRASLVASGADAAGGAPAVAHVRDCLPSGAVSSLVARIIRARAARVVANSAYTLDRFGAGESGVVVHNSVDQTRFAARPASSSSNGSFTLGVVAQLTPWKGQDDAVRALALVRAHHPNARLVLAGSAKFVSAQTRFDNKTFVRDLKALIADLGVADAVEFAGECEDVVSIYRGLDAVLVPSWEEPFGRAVIESMAMGVPVIATDVGGTAEIVDDRRTGLLAPPRSPERWAAAVRELIENPRLRVALAEAGGREVARRFRPEHHAEAMIAVYREALGRTDDVRRRGESTRPAAPLPSSRP
jgi:glycosyltransferase involved in cell wall biosynthesis